jgi:hypothetical protein
MSRSGPASNPISYHKRTKQYYITRGGTRIYLGSDKNQALAKYHQLGLRVEPVQRELAPPINITAKNLANRFLVAQQANWRNPETTLKCYKDWGQKALYISIPRSLVDTVALAPISW